MAGPTVLVAPPLPDDPVPAEGPRPGTLWRVRDRASFAALRRSTARARRGAVSVTWLPPVGDPTPPRLAFAVPRRAGGAVARNRIRRRLRAACAELRATGRLPAGTYLVVGGPELATVPFDELIELVDGAARAARDRSAR